MAQKGKLFLGYRFYNFTKRDPVCDMVEKIMAKEGFVGKGQTQRMSLLSGLATSTVHNLVSQQTKLPRHSTIGAIIGSLGYKQEFIKDKSFMIDREREIIKARAERKKASIRK